MKTKLVLPLAVAMLLMGISAFSNPDPSPELGKTIFMTRCASCHNVNQNLTGPALAGIEERRSMDWIVNFVHSSQTMVKKGDKDAVSVFEKFNKVPMPDHPDLTEDNIKSIVEYIKAEKKSGEVKKNVKAGNNTASAPLSLSTDYVLFFALFGSIVLLIVALLFAARVNNMMRRQV